MRALHRKILLACLSTALGVLVAAWILHLRRADEYLLLDKSREIQRALLERQLEPRGLASITPGAKPESALKREPMDETLVNKYFLNGYPLTYDPHAYFHYVPNLNETIALEEHPDHHYVRRTNSAGEREDHETFVTKPDVFVLVTGDSHTDGICNNSESYANLLEFLLERSHPGRNVEVLNAGVQSYCPYNYLGVLEKYAPRGPDVFVTAYYGGNDFVEVLRPYHFFNHTVPPPPARGHWDEIVQAKTVGASALSQGIDEILYFKRQPDEIDLALEACIAVSLEIDRQCRELGIPWILVYIPSVFDGPWSEQRELRRQCQEALSLSDYDVGVINRIADRMLARLSAQGIVILDLRPVFAADPGPWYWSELHMDLRAHRKLALLLEPRIEALLDRRHSVPRTSAEAR